MKTKQVFTCQACGEQAPKWLGRCSGCGSWNSFVEETERPAEVKHHQSARREKNEPVLLRSVSSDHQKRFEVGIGELDRVLGGGIVPGSVILIGGDPGIGKSTICLQVANKFAKAKQRVLYVSAEESVSQTKLRASRLGDEIQDGLFLVSETDLTLIIEYIERLKPTLVIIDSIQVIFHPEISSSPGSVSQVRECAGHLVQFAKRANVATILIGHVTKEGSIAGPRVLEHLVDTVLYFEGERYSVYRILRAVKNRFGSTNEIGVFQMSPQGLDEVANPSEIFLSDRTLEASGSAITCIMEGSRPLVVEVQALVTRANYGYSQRRAQGMDHNRLSLLIAVLEKRLGYRLGDRDVFINIVGGMKVQDPALDLAVATAISSAYNDTIVDHQTVVFGEVGLGGEVRSIPQVALRVNEVSKLGFTRCIMPANNATKDVKGAGQFTINGVNTIKEALSVLGKEGE